MSPVLFRIDEPIALDRVQAPHVANGIIEGLSPLRRQLSELLKDLVGLLLLAGREMFPGLHAAEHALLLLGRQVGKVLQAILQLPLLGRRKTAELRIVFERAALLRGREIFIAAQPVSGMAGLIGRTLIPRRLVLRKLVTRDLVTRDSVTLHLAMLNLVTLSLAMWNLIALRLPAKTGRVRLHSLLRRV